MLCGHAATRTALGAQNERHPAFAAGHQPEFCRLIDDHIHAEHGKIDIKNFHNRPRPGNCRPHADADHASLGNRRVAHPFGAIFCQQAFGHLVGPATLRDAFADDEHHRIAGHFFVNRLAKGFAVHQLSCHWGLLFAGWISSRQRMRQTGRR